MPTIQTQRPPQPQRVVQAAPQVPGIVSAGSLKRSWMKVLLYGRNRVGKSRLSAEWPKPMLAIACEPRENGGADTLIGVDGVDVAVVALKPLPGEMNGGSVKVEALLDWMESTVPVPYQTVTIDVTALQDIVLGEIMGWETVDKVKQRPKRGGGGGPGRPEFMERANRCINVFRRLKDLPCHVLFIGQEKDHNPTKDEDGNAVGSKMLMSAQEKSYMGVTLGEASALWLQNACQHIHQLSMDAEMTSTTTTVDVAGVPTSQTVTHATGRYVRRLRWGYSPNYQTGVTLPAGVREVPEFIETNDPKAMYEDVVRVASGQRALHGKYN